MITVALKDGGATLTVGGGSSAMTSWIITGTDDPVAAYNALAAEVDSDIGGLPLLSIKVDLVTVESSAGGVFDGEARYGPLEDEEFIPLGETRVSIDSTGGSIRATHGTPVASYGANPADHEGAVGVGDAGVEGVEIGAARYIFSVATAMSDLDFDATYKRNALALRNKVNNATFDGWAPGEVRYLGFRADTNGEGNWEVSHQFEVSENETGIVISPTITVAAKKGHEYLWIEYEDAVDDTAKAAVKKPLAAHVVEFYPEANFGVLGLVF